MFSARSFRRPTSPSRAESSTKSPTVVDAGVLRTTLHDEIAGINAANLREGPRDLESGAAIGKIVHDGF